MIIGTKQTCYYIYRYLSKKRKSEDIKITCEEEELATTG